LPFIFEATPTTFPCLATDTFCVEAGYPKFSGGQDGQQAVVKGWVNYDEYPAFIAEMQPPSVDNGTTMTIQYGAALPGFSYLRVTEWDAEPWPAHTAEQDANDYFKTPLMYVTLTFRFVKQQINSGEDPSSDNPDPVPYLIHRLSVGGQVLSLDNDGLMWDDIRRRLGNWNPEPFFAEGGPDEECQNSKRQKVGVTAGMLEKINAVLQIPHIEHEITWPRVPRPPFTAIKTLVGCVNQSAMSFKTGTIPAECLLFTGARVQQTQMSNGENSWELVYSFAERQVVARDQQALGGWNHFFRASRPRPIYPYLTNGDPGGIADHPTGSRYTSDDYPGPYTAHDVDGEYTWFYCPNLPGFYRLELNPGTNEDMCIEEEYDSDSGLISKISLKTGYFDDLAIFKKADLGRLFLREPNP